MGKVLKLFKDWLFAFVLIGVGLLATFQEVFEYAGVHISNNQQWTLRIVGLLAIALGLERFTKFARFEDKIAEVGKNFDALQKDIHSRFSVGVAEGYDKVYDKATEFMRDAELSIRTVVFASRPVASERFAKAVVDHLQKHKSVNYEVTLGIDLSSVSEEFWEIIEKRNDVYKKAGVATRTHLTFLNTTKPIGFDVLVIDDRHFAMSFSSAPNTPDATREFAIYFEEQPRVAKRIGAWINNMNPVLMKPEEAKEEWAKEYKSKNRTI